MLVDLSNTADTISSERLEIVQEGDVEGEATLACRVCARKVGFMLQGLWWGCRLPRSSLMVGWPINSWLQAPRLWGQLQKQLVGIGDALGVERLVVAHPFMLPHCLGLQQKAITRAGAKAKMVARPKIPSPGR